MFRFFSLTHRLAIFFTIVAAAVVLGLGMLFLVATERHFLELDRITLKDKQHLIENIVVNANSTDEIPSRLRESLNNHHGLFVIVKNANGNVLFRTEGFQPPATLDAPTPEHRISEIQGWENQGREFRAMNLRFNPAHSAAPPLDVLIAIDMEDHMQFMAQLRRTLAAWFAHDMKVAPSAGALHVHRNTLEYRLRRIGEIYAIEAKLRQTSNAQASALLARARQLVYHPPIVESDAVAPRKRSTRKEEIAQIAGREAEWSQQRSNDLAAAWREIARAREILNGLIADGPTADEVERLIAAEAKSAGIGAGERRSQDKGFSAHMPSVISQSIRAISASISTGGFSAENGTSLTLFSRTVKTSDAKQYRHSDSGKSS